MPMCSLVKTRAVAGLWPASLPKPNASCPPAESPAEQRPHCRQLPGPIGGERDYPQREMGPAGWPKTRAAIRLCAGRCTLDRQALDVPSRHGCHNGARQGGGGGAPWSPWTPRIRPSCAPARPHPSPTRPGARPGCREAWGGVEGGGPPPRPLGQPAAQRSASWVLGARGVARGGGAPARARTLTRAAAGPKPDAREQSVEAVQAPAAGARRWPAPVRWRRQERREHERERHKTAV
jgi:hypothetical protein